MKFEIYGIMQLGNARRKFRKSIDANSEGDARNTLYALLGSANRLKRSQIKIEGVAKG